MPRSIVRLGSAPPRSVPARSSPVTDAAEHVERSGTEAAQIDRHPRESCFARSRSECSRPFRCQPLRQFLCAQFDAGNVVVISNAQIANDASGTNTPLSALDLAKSFGGDRDPVGKAR